MSVLTRVQLRPGPSYDENAWYWQLPAVAQLRTEGLDLAPVTVLVGENGSGKSTLVEAIARGWKESLTAHVKHWMPSPSTEDTGLWRHLSLLGEQPRPQGGVFLRAESMHAHFAALDGAGAELRAFGDQPLNARSHGESFLAFLQSRATERGLWILDEPEAALSFRSCLQLVALIDGIARTGSQVLLATHSPLLAAVPGARVLELGPAGAVPTGWEDLELVTDWQDFLAHPRRWLRHLVPD